MLSVKTLYWDDTSEKKTLNEKWMRKKPRKHALGKKSIKSTLNETKRSIKTVGDEWTWVFCLLSHRSTQRRHHRESKPSSRGTSSFSSLSNSSEQIFQISLSDYNTIEHLSFTYAITFTFTCSTGKVGHFNLSSSFVRFKCSFHFFLNEYDFGMNQSNISQYLFFYWNFHFLRLNLSKWLCSSLFIQP